MADLHINNHGISITRRYEIHNFIEEYREENIGYARRGMLSISKSLQNLTSFHTYMYYDEMSQNCRSKFKSDDEIL